MKRKKIIMNLCIALTVIIISPGIVAKAEHNINGTNNTMILSSIKDTNNLPKKYDSRDLGYVNPIRNQGSIGSCWSFANTAALEAAAKKNFAQTYDFSEIHMAATNGLTLASSGGSGFISAAYLASWHGPISEKDAPYPDPAVPSNVDLSVKGKPLFHVQDIIFFDSTKQGEDRIAGIKEDVKKYGAMTTHVAGAECNVKDGTIYTYKDDEPTNHEILIVGWDDDYSRDNYKGENKPEHDGAFICRNSWGENVGDKGYFYLSYEDKNLLKDSLMTAYGNLERTDNYKDVFCGSLNTGIQEFNIEISEDQKKAVIPIVMMKQLGGIGIGEKEQISAVGVFAPGKNMKAELYYMDDITKAKKSFYEIDNKDMIKVKDLVFDNAGFRTIKLDKPIIPKDRENFIFFLKVEDDSIENKADIKSKFIKLPDIKNDSKAKAIKGGASILAGRFYTDNADGTKPNEKPEVKTGWKLEEDTWYFYNEKGEKQSGWLQQGHNWYYLNEDGSMVTGWKQVKGVWYFFHGNGLMKRGWHHEGDRWYYLSESGVMQTGLNKIDEKWYYFYDTGRMAKNDNINDFEVGENGAIITKENEALKKVMPYRLEGKVIYSGLKEIPKETPEAYSYLEECLLGKIVYEFENKINDEYTAALYYVDLDGNVYRDTVPIDGKCIKVN